MKEDALPQRKRNRLEAFDYSTPGAYFITVCTQNRRNLLGRVVGGGALDAPEMQLSKTGKIVEKYILSGNRVENVTVDKYVIMPDHIHMILVVDGGQSRAPAPTLGCGAIPGGEGTRRLSHTIERGCQQALPAGPSRAPAPTNAVIPHFVSTLKRFANKAAGRNLFQRSYHDHVIRGEQDYLKIWQYIDSNAAKWAEDCFYNEAEEEEML